jgi:D-tyrosyl-tRNA(Tyr) deacylase
MRAVVQRVAEAEVMVQGKVVGAIGKGVAILLGVKEGDGEENVRWLAEKCANLRIFENEEGKFDFSLLEIQGEALVVSQFTLYGDCKKGRRPSFTKAAAPEMAEKLYESFVNVLRKMGINVQTGMFGNRMMVKIHNEGPVTLIVDSGDVK